MFKSLYGKMVFILALLILSLIAVVGVFLTVSVAEHYMNEFAQRMSVTFNTHAELVQSLHQAAQEGEAPARLARC